MRELGVFLATVPHQTFFLFPGLQSDGKIGSELKVLFVMRRCQPYEGRVFELRMTFPPDYPFKTPRLRFETPIYHYAVSTLGGMCLDKFKDRWSPALSLAVVLREVDELIHDHSLTDPKAELSQRSWLSELLRTNPAEYFAQANAHSRVHAKKVPDATSSMDARSLINLLE
jgi:ubiquitin-conjugating enzyme E2 D/E